MDKQLKQLKLCSNNQHQPIKAPKKQYSQTWKSYNQAKTNENIIFKKLLIELLSLIEENNIKKSGRKGFTIQEKIFCMCIKIYYQSDLRKTESILKELIKLGYINGVPSFKSIDNFFNDTKITKILNDLILISSLPLAHIEETGAIDSTGFSVSKYERWVNFKYGSHTGKERVWRKAHACMGCKTNIFLSVEVTESNIADVSMFKKVVGNKTQFFDMVDFVGDKAYLSREIMNFLNVIGLTPYIPFKKNVTGKSRGSRIWRVMFEKFRKNFDDYMKVYHRRSNIETGFYMIKQKFGSYLLTKNFEANVNEIKIKFLCHNLCVLIQEAFESDISVNFEDCVKTIQSVKLFGL